MRIVVAIPHYFAPTSKALHASTRADNVTTRLAALSTAVVALHAHFGGSQHVLDYETGSTEVANASGGNQVVVIVCTTRGQHLVEELPVPRSLYTHREFDVDPMLLGFECRGVLRDHVPEPFDFYCYLEDDIIVRDPLFFDKQRCFSEAAGIECVLQPNRFEMVGWSEFQKLYIDGNTPSGAVESRIAASGDTDLELHLMERPFRFTRPGNPHSGTYFLTRAQMELWTRQAHFLDRDCGFVGPLESAATLGILKTFKVFKPARETANFLEVEHFSPDYSPRVGTWFAFAGAQAATSLVGRVAERVARRLRSR